jgi:hypothetical protein
MVICLKIFREPGNLFGESDQSCARYDLTDGLADEVRCQSEREAIQGADD